MTDHWMFNTCNTMDATVWADTWYPSGAPEFTPDFSRFRIVSCVVFCGPFSFFLSCQCYDIRRLIPPLVCSNLLAFTKLLWVVFHVQRAWYSLNTRQQCTSRPHLSYTGSCTPSDFPIVVFVAINTMWFSRAHYTWPCYKLTKKGNVVGVIKSFLNIHIYQFSHPSFSD